MAQQNQLSVSKLLFVSYIEQSAIPHFSPIPLHKKNITTGRLKDEVDGEREEQLDYTCRCTRGVRSIIEVVRPWAWS